MVDFVNLEGGLPAGARCSHTVTKN